jgi:Ni/Co efflux regulator RcnB
MKRLVFALALVATVGACKKAEQPAAGAADSSKMMMSDSSKMMSDSSKMMDTTKH